MKNKRYSEFFTYVHFYKKDTKSQIKEFISEQLEYNSEAQVTEDESGNSELLKYDIESDTIDWYFSDENGNEVKKENSITNGDGEYVENMYRVYFSRVIISDYQGDDYYLEDWMEQNDYYTTEKREKELMKEEKVRPIITSDEKVAKEYGFKRFGVNLWEENKYSRIYYAKSEEDIHECLDDVFDDFECGRFEFRKGSVNTDIFEEEE